MSHSIEKQASFSLSDSAPAQAVQTSLSRVAQKPFGNVVSSGGLQDERMRRPINRSPGRSLLHRDFIEAGAVLLIAAFGTDYVYCTTAVWQWANSPPGSSRLA